MDIKLVVNKPDQNVIDLLEDILKEAKAGEIEGIAVATNYVNTEVNSCHAGKNSTDLLGCVSIMQADLIDHWRGHRAE